MTNPGLTDPTDQIAALREALAKCPICGSQPRRSARKGSGGVVCYAGSHRLQSLAETQPEADRIWNDMAADWAARNTRDGQADLALRVVEAIAEVEHIATAIDRNGLNSRSAQLRDAARVFRAALALPHPVGDRESVARECLARQIENLPTRWNSETQKHDLNEMIAAGIREGRDCTLWLRDVIPAMLAFADQERPDSPVKGSEAKDAGDAPTNLDMLIGRVNEIAVEIEAKGHCVLRDNDFGDIVDIARLLAALPNTSVGQGA